MKERQWVRIISKKKINLPPDRKGVEIFVNYGEGIASRFSANRIDDMWVLYDPFTSKWRKFPYQDKITHWRYFSNDLHCLTKIERGQK